MVREVIFFSSGNCWRNNKFFKTYFYSPNILIKWPQKQRTINRIDNQPRNDFAFSQPTTNFFVALRSRLCGFAVKILQIKNTWKHASALSECKLYNQWRYVRHQCATTISQTASQVGIVVAAHMYVIISVILAYDFYYQTRSALSAARTFITLTVTMTEKHTHTHTPASRIIHKFAPKVTDESSHTSRASHTLASKHAHANVSYKITIVRDDMHRECECECLFLLCNPKFAMRDLHFRARSKNPLRALCWLAKLKSSAHRTYTHTHTHTSEYISLVTWLVAFRWNPAFRPVHTKTQPQLASHILTASSIMCGQISWSGAHRANEFALFFFLQPFVACERDIAKKALLARFNTVSAVTHA